MLIEIAPVKKYAVNSVTPIALSALLCLGTISMASAAPQRGPDSRAPRSAVPQRDTQQRNQQNSYSQGRQADQRGRIEGNSNSRHEDSRREQRPADRNGSNLRGLPSADGRSARDPRSGGQALPPTQSRPDSKFNNDSNRNSPRSDNDRGERRYIGNPRSNLNGGNEDSERRNWNSGNNRDRNDPRWNRDRDRDQNRWRDNRGHVWDRDRGWYDNYRQSHYRYYGGRYYARERFRVGLYLAPLGFYPHVWLSGEYLPYSYYSSDYFIRDYWSYQLFDPPYGCRWVRVRNDALLIDIASGEVVDAVYDIFW